MVGTFWIGCTYKNHGPEFHIHNCITRLIFFITIYYPYYFFFYNRPCCILDGPCCPFTNEFKVNAFWRTFLFWKLNRSHFWMHILKSYWPKMSRLKSEISPKSTLASSKNSLMQMCLELHVSFLLNFFRKIQTSSFNFFVHLLKFP